MNNLDPLMDTIKDVPTYKTWDDDGNWETIAILEMSRNFGVADKDLLNRLERFFKKDAPNDGIDFFLAKLTEGEMHVLADLIGGIMNSKLEGITVERHENSRFTYRGTKGNIRITFTLSTAHRATMEQIKRIGVWKLPFGFMVDVIARKKS